MYTDCVFTKVFDDDDADNNNNNNNLMDNGIEVYATEEYAITVLFITPCLNTETHYHYLLMSSSSTWHTDQEVEG
jgi:hypothetical protein